MTAPLVAATSLEITLSEGLDFHVSTRLKKPLVTPIASASCRSVSLEERRYRLSAWVMLEIIH